LKKTEILKKSYGEEIFNQIEFVVADLDNKDSVLKACEGAHYIVHVASPTPPQKKVQDIELIRPAEEGMKSILEAAMLNKVKKIVVTSSDITIVGSCFKS
jgi:dihydroflavonol-4-reductase